MLLRFIREQEGDTAMEYGLIAALIAVASLGSVAAIRLALEATFVYWSNNM